MLPVLSVSGPFPLPSLSLSSPVEVHIHLEPPSLLTRTSFGLDLRLFLTVIEVPPALASAEDPRSAGSVGLGRNLPTAALTGAFGGLQDSPKGLLRPIFFPELQ